MKITKIEPIPVEIEQDIPFTTHRETMNFRQYVIIKIYTDEGIVGIGEASTIETWGESQKACVMAIKDIIEPSLIGSDPFNLELILERMDIVLEGFPFTKAGIEMCVLDIQGKSLNKPVYDLIGGLYRDWIPQSRSVGFTDVEKMIDWALMLKEMGTTTIKIKIGIDITKDVKAVHGIRKAIGNDIALKVDANTGWKEPKTAIKVLKEIEECNIMFAEQPIYGWDLDGMSFVRQSVDIPIAADESVWNSHDVVRIFEKQAADILTIYLMKAGGFYRNREVAAVAKAVGFPCILGGMGEMGVGSAANVHFAAAVPNMIYPADLHVPPFLIKDDIINESFEYSSKGVKVPNRPGLGVSLNNDKLNKYRTDK
jgi:o-succinylbenzoate synthase